MPNLEEPIGSVPVRLTGDRLQDLTVRIENPSSILCLGQSFPTPSFR